MSSLDALTFLWCFLFCIVVQIPTLVAAIHSPPDCLLHFLPLLILPDSVYDQRYTLIQIPVMPLIDSVLSDYLPLSLYIFRRFEASLSIVLILSGLTLSGFVLRSRCLTGVCTELLSKILFCFGGFVTLLVCKSDPFLFVCIDPFLSFV